MRTLKFGGIEERMTFPDHPELGTCVIVPKEDVARYEELEKAARGLKAAALRLLDDIERDDAHSPNSSSFCDVSYRIDAEGELTLALAAIDTEETE